MRAAVFALGLLTLPVPPAMAEEPIEWVVSDTGGSRIEIPSFFADGKVEPIRVVAEGNIFYPKSYPGANFEQFKAITTASPYEEIEATFINDDGEYQIQYKIDHPSFGAISGTRADDDIIFYGMCKKRKDKILICFSMIWKTRDRDIFDPISKQISESFKMNN